ncbi:MAG: hypothetical protein SWO11_22435, partial [Thermodesulfobacteriota bacterium]|nr:hypothetical protein [Thermodesulfobacteriota bacterium]
PTPPSSHVPHHISPQDVAFCILEVHRHLNLSLLRGSILSLYLPLSTLHWLCYHYQRMTQGWCGWLTLHHGTLSAPTSCRF